MACYHTLRCISRVPLGKDDWWKSIRLWEAILRPKTWASGSGLHVKRAYVELFSYGGERALVPSTRQKGRLATRDCPAGDWEQCRTVEDTQTRIVVEGRPGSAAASLSTGHVLDAVEPSAPVDAPMSSAHLQPVYSSCKIYYVVDQSQVYRIDCLDGQDLRLRPPIAETGTAVMLVGHISLSRSKKSSITHLPGA